MNGRMNGGGERALVCSSRCAWAGKGVGCRVSISILNFFSNLLVLIISITSVLYFHEGDV